MLNAQILSYIFFTCESLKFESVLFRLPVKVKLDMLVKNLKIKKEEMHIFFL